MDCLQIKQIINDECNYDPHLKIKQENELEIIHIIGEEINEESVVEYSSSYKKGRKRVRRPVFVLRIGGTFQCSKCDYKTEKRDSTYMHYLKNHLKRKFSCSFCDKIFTDPSNRNRHEKVAHNKSGKNTGRKVGRISCPHCPSNFGRMDNLTLHLKRIHKIFETPEVIEQNQTKMEGLECFHCGLKFNKSAKSDILHHLIYQHFPQLVEQQKYRCKLCPQKIFLLPEYLKKHIEGTHEEKNKCPKCNKIYKSDSSFRSHMKLNNCTRNDRIV